MKVKADFMSPEHQKLLMLFIQRIANFYGINGAECYFFEERELLYKKIKAINHKAWLTAFEFVESNVEMGKAIDDTLLQNQNPTIYQAQILLHKEEITGAGLRYIDFCQENNISLEGLAKPKKKKALR
jgi:hypothetical protein